MASANIVSITSSPLKEFKAQSFTMSSSPLPSPSEMYRKAFPSARDKHDPSISEINQNSVKSTSGFIKASQLDFRNSEPMKIQKSLGEDSKSVIEVPAKKAVKSRAKKTLPAEGNKDKEKTSKAPRKTTVKRVQCSKDVLPEKKPRKSRAKNPDTAGQQESEKKTKSVAVDAKTKIDAPAKEKKPRKSRAKKPTEDVQQRLSGSVTKVSVKSTPSDNKTLEGTFDVGADCVDYGLVKAVKRKSNWSPPPNPIVANLPIVDGAICTFDASSPAPLSTITNGFNNLLGNFGFTNTEPINSLTTLPVLETGIVRKRKLIELVDMKHVTEGATPKPKLPKKKSRTITGLATSAFMEEKADDTDLQPAPLLQYFSYKTTDRSTKAGSKVTAKSRSRSPVKRVKKGSAQAPILLSPESAMKQVHRQDFIFGTSSQLAREESPTYLRDLQQAMQASNTVFDDDPFEDPFKDVVDEPSAIAPHGKSRMSSRKGGLWSASARDAAGSLLDVEMVDITNTPLSARQQNPEEIKPAELAPAEINYSLSAKDDVWHEVEEDAGIKPPTSKPDAATPSKPGPIEAAIRLELQSSPLPVSPVKSKPSKRPAALAAEISRVADKTATKTKPKKHQMPDYGAYTMFQLQKQIATYHFKPIKSRDAMIAVLEKCWEGQQSRTALGNLPTNTKPVTKSQVEKEPVPVETKSPKKRGRPKKDKSTDLPTSPSKTKKQVQKSKNADAVGSEDSDVPMSQSRKRKSSPKTSPKKVTRQPIEDISDPEPHLTPSPPRRRLSEIKSPPRPLQLSRLPSTADSIIPASSQDSLFKHITKAITSLSPTKDPTNPTWHEKILLYDPIVLEDLTIWLNTGALEKVGWDGEVEPKIVKKWCEGRGNVVTLPNLLSHDRFYLKEVVNIFLTECANEN